MKPVYKNLNLFTEGRGAYHFVPSDQAGAALSISRETGEIALNGKGWTVPHSAQRFHKNIFGIYGIITLSLTHYIIVITGRDSLGHIMGKEVFKATDFEVLPLDPKINVKHPPHPVEVHLLALVHGHLQAGNFLFSYEWDLTRRLQSQYEDDEDSTIWKKADERFFWNRYVQSRLIDASRRSQQHEYDGYILPLMYGTFDIRSATISGRNLELCVISRRSRHRAGTRYFRRGIDHEGNVANFVETEQLLLIRGSSGKTEEKFSFVQIRGSVPVFWAEINTLRYKPDLQVMDLSGTADAMEAHFKQQIKQYGNLTLVSLVNNKGHELPVKLSYERWISHVQLPNVKYTYFDFHNECKRMRWDRISVLIDRIQGELEHEGYFRLGPDAPLPLTKQLGTVRTNCMDNLDRTNVVQASLAKWTLNKQLREAGIIGAQSSIEEYPTFFQNFREIWANHGDTVAMAYAGTGAMKSDFTRTNVRTKKGALSDGYIALMRYVKNNYFDGPRQDGFDLMTGAWKTRGPSSASALITDKRHIMTRSMPYLTYGALFMVCAGLTLPRSSDWSLFYYFAVWFSIAFLSFSFILLHGVSYVAWPRLIPATEAVYYNGPGFRSAHNGIGFGKLKEDFLAKQKVLMANGGATRRKGA